VLDVGLYLRMLQHHKLKCVAYILYLKSISKLGVGGWGASRLLTARVKGVAGAISETVRAGDLL
jgi:hypothetical protein